MMVRRRVLLFYQENKLVLGPELRKVVRFQPTWPDTPDS
jgi:hypothetical protein